MPQEQYARPSLPWLIAHKTASPAYSILSKTNAHSTHPYRQQLTCAGLPGGRTEATVRVNGFPQDARTFTRSSGYVEQTDLHSPQTTVAEALWFSSRLRLPPSVKRSAVLRFNQRVSTQLLESASCTSAMSQQG